MIDYLFMLCLFTLALVIMPSASVFLHVVYLMQFCTSRNHSKQTKSPTFCVKILPLPMMQQCENTDENSFKNYLRVVSGTKPFSCLPTNLSKQLSLWNDKMGMNYVSES